MFEDGGQDARARPIELALHVSSEDLGLRHRLGWERRPGRALRHEMYPRPWPRDGLARFSVTTVSRSAGPTA